MSKRILVTYTLIFSGAILQGLAMSLFLFPHNIPSGGAAGLAILINHWLQLPLGLALWFVNFAFLVLALKYFGYTWTIRTMLSVTITSVTVSLASEHMELSTNYFWVDLLSGGIIFGIGVGLLIRNGASSGGMVIPALMIAKMKGTSPGRVMLWINFFIFLLTATVIDWTIVIFAILCQTISTNIIDFIYHFKMPYSYSTEFGWRKK
ncbi:YitT family protein [Cytobacillus suaedae]|nr:YitT family protein [Cytobacillus suaedae]